MTYANAGDVSGGTGAVGTGANRPMGNGTDSVGTVNLSTIESTVTTIAISEYSDQISGKRIPRLEYSIYLHNTGKSCMTNHLTSTNFLYRDGHVKALGH